MKLTHRVVDGLSGSSSRKSSRNTRSPRARTSIAEAARQAAAKNAAGVVFPSQPDFDALAGTGRLGSLTPEARKVALQGPASLRNFLVEAGELRADAAQDVALRKLESLFTCFSRSHPGDVHGLYVYGHVGTGKTMLMDLFLASVREAYPKLRVYRTHLHEFMRAVHGELNRLKRLRSAGEDEEVCGDGHKSSSSATRTENFFKVLPERWWLLGEQDDYGRRRTGMAAACVHASRNGQSPTSVEKLGVALAKELDVLCFDEVAITTIQDCVVLGPLVRILCERGVVMVATSNRAPEDLYAGGLNRHVHLPQLVSAIRAHCEIHDIRSEVDHRMLFAAAESHGLPGVFSWKTIAGCADGRAFLDSWWERESGTHISSGQSTPVTVGYGRSMNALQSPCGSCGRFSFSELCAIPLGSDDFAALCSHFQVLLISDVPRLRAEQHSEAQRWIWLLDNCYEHHTRLVMTSAAAGPDDLVDLHSVAMVGAGGGRSLQEVSFAVARATSRLHEMQTEAFQAACAERRTRGADAGAKSVAAALQRGLAQEHVHHARLME